MSGTIYVDLRCLQDRDYQRRGIGYHTSALLRGRKRSQLSGWKTIGLVDPSMPALIPEFGSLVDEISTSANPCWNGEQAVFIDGSPMTHDPRFSLRVQNHPRLISAAVLHDFIPLDWPGCLPTVASRMEYLAKIARLRKFDLFFPVSNYTARRLYELTGVSREKMKVTGSCVRGSLYEIRDRLTVTPSPYHHNPPYFITLGGDDRRKNTDTALRAVQRLNLLYARRIPLKVIGFYCDAYKSDLLRMAGHREGEGFLEFSSFIPDEDVVSLHSGAIAAIAPSHIEGFSLPVVEASVCGCPVIASTCDAQMELIEQPEALFQSDDSAALSEKLETLFLDPASRASLVAAQAHLAPKFKEDTVGARFWSAVEAAIENRRGISLVKRPRKPFLAFLSPYPPDSSDAALQTAMAMKAGREWFDSEIYTDAARPLAFGNTFRDAGTISLAPFIDKRYSGIVSALGNSFSHKRAFEVFERFGGPCILHDVRLTQIYFERLGPEGFLKFAGGILNRPVSIEEVHFWLQDRNPPSLFVERIIQQASPLMVLSATQQALLKKRYGTESHVLTYCPTAVFEEYELTPGTRQTVRERLGISPNTFLIASFGQVARANGMDSCILSLELLRSWNIPAELYFIGNAEDSKGEIARIATLFDVNRYVHHGTEFAEDTAYRDFLIASDVAVQLSPYGFGHPPITLTNCISAGLRAVASSDAAKSCDAPAYVSTVPDRYSPLLVAEQLALIWETRTQRATHSEARAAYLQTHNSVYYARRLVEILGIA